MTEDTETRRMKSDLLHMIGGAFDVAGISSPSPPRDVHLWTAEPVPVGMVASSGMRSAA